MCQARCSVLYAHDLIYSSELLCGAGTTIIFILPIKMLRLEDIEQIAQRHS